MTPDLTTEQAAEILGTTPQRVRELLARGDLAGYRLGPRLWRITRAALDEFRAGGPPEPGAPARPRRRSARARSAAHEAACERLRAMGVMKQGVARA